MLLRLPLTVQPVFLEWLGRTYPQRRARVQSRIANTRGGKLNDPQFGSRMRGTGALADQIRQTFQVFAHKYGLDGPSPPLDTRHFRPPRPHSGQLRLF